MPENSIVNGVINTKSGPILVRELSTFLSLFESVYTDAVLFEREQLTEYEGDSTLGFEYVAEMVANRLAKQGLASSASRNLHDVEELAIIDISRENPVHLVFSGEVVALVAAVIISGGEFEVTATGIKVKIPPLGKGIAKLRKAIRGMINNRDIDI